MACWALLLPLSNRQSGAQGAHGLKSRAVSRNDNFSEILENTLKVAHFSPSTLHRSSAAERRGRQRDQQLNSESLSTNHIDTTHSPDRIAVATRDGYR